MKYIEWIMFAIQAVVMAILLWALFGCEVQAKQKSLEVIVYQQSPQKIQLGWEKFSGKKIRVSGWSQWYTKDDGTRLCKIYVPFENHPQYKKIYNHEIKHCIEGHWHGGPGVVKDKL